jgi:hypothetical protein
VSLIHPDPLVWKSEEDLSTTKGHFSRLLKRYKSSVTVLSLLKKKDDDDKESGVNTVLSSPSVDSGKRKESKATSLFSAISKTIHIKEIKEIGKSLASSSARTLGIADTKESMLASAYSDSVTKLSKTGMALKLVTYDFHFHRKAKADITGDLLELLKEDVEEQGLTVIGDSILSTQEGIIRVNCVDCLDRTNVAQYCTARGSIVRMLTLIGAIKDIDVDLVDVDTCFPDISIALRSLFKSQGDKIALQYAGSLAMHSQSIDTSAPSARSLRSRSPSPSARKTTEDESKVSGTITNAMNAVKRYYSNAVKDSSRQDALDLFLGNFVPSKERGYIIWERKDDESKPEQSSRQDVDLIFPDGEKKLLVPKIMRQGYMSKTPFEDEEGENEEEEQDESQEEELEPDLAEFATEISTQIPKVEAVEDVKVQSSVLDSDPFGDISDPFSPDNETHE